MDVMETKADDGADGPEYVEFPGLEGDDYLRAKNFYKYLMDKDVSAWKFDKVIESTNNYDSMFENLDDADVWKNKTGFKRWYGSRTITRKAQEVYLKVMQDWMKKEEEKTINYDTLEEMGRAANIFDEIIEKFAKKQGSGNDTTPTKPAKDVADKLHTIVEETTLETTSESASGKLRRFIKSCVLAVCTCLGFLSFIFLLLCLHPILPLIMIILLIP